MKIKVNGNARINYVDNSTTIKEKYSPVWEGDEFKNINDSNIIDKASVQDSFNPEKDYSQDIKHAPDQISRFIGASGDLAAVGALAAVTLFIVTKKS